MASKRFKKVLLIRFVSYLTVVIAFLAVIFEFGPIFSTEAKYTWDQLLRIEHTLVSTDFGIVIEKINANAKVVANVDPGDERAYTQALTQGVAAATGSTKPREP